MRQRQQQRDHSAKVVDSTRGIWGKSIHHAPCWWRRHGLGRRRLAASSGGWRPGQVVQPEDSDSRFFPGGESMRWHAESKDESIRVKCNDSHPINGLGAMNGLGVQDRVMGVTSHKSCKEREQRGSSSHHPSGRWWRHGLRRRWLRISLLRRGRHALLGRRRLCHSPWGCLRGGRHASCRGERV